MSFFKRVLRQTLALGLAYFLLFGLVKLPYDWPAYFIAIIIAQLLLELADYLLEKHQKKD